MRYLQERLGIDLGVVREGTDLDLDALVDKLAQHLELLGLLEYLARDRCVLVG